MYLFVWSYTLDINFTVPWWSLTWSVHFNCSLSFLLLISSVIFWYSMHFRDYAGSRIRTNLPWLSNSLKWLFWLFFHQVRKISNPVWIWQQYTDENAKHNTHRGNDVPVRDMPFIMRCVWVGGQSDYPRTPQDTPGHPRTLQDSIICMFNILYERVDDGLVLVCWCIN